MREKQFISDMDDFDTNMMSETIWKSYEFLNEYKILGEEFNQLKTDLDLPYLNRNLDERN